MKDLVQEIKLELTEMKKLGMWVPEKAFQFSEQEALTLRANGMSVSEIADMFILSA